jgi:hypothetical protein
MQSEVGQLVAQGSIHIADIGAQEHYSLTWQSHGSTPVRGSAGRERIQAPSIRNDDEAQGARRTSPETWPTRGLSGPAGEVSSKSKLLRPSYGSDESHTDGGRFALEHRGGCSTT